MIHIKDYNYEELRELLLSYMEEEYVLYVDKYYKEALKIYEGMTRYTGEEYIMHPINVAYILADLKMDPITIGCALLHEAISLSKMTYEEIETMFGTDAANIINSISKISNLKQTFKVNNPEKYRRILVGLCDNSSALFIKLADRLHNLRTIHVHSKSHIKYIIDETQNIYIPIAHRLGLKNIKGQMEDLCLKTTVKKDYDKILYRINATKDELEESLSKTKEVLSNILDAHNIKFKIVSRVKSVRGIYNKLKKGKKWEDIYDLLGIRILVNTIEECYRVLGLVHSKYQPIQSRMKDYIANPKGNNYQSLHTTVFAEDNRMYEIQIRTFEMDEIAEKGVASHYSYKENKDGSNKDILDTTLENLRALIELNDIESNMEFFGNIKEELKKDQIYTLTPKGDIIELPAGSTPLDFAYKIHSEVGHSTVSALVNNKIVKLNYELKDGDLVELITKKGHTPSKGWLKLVKTESAKSRIKSYFYKKERDRYISLGKEMIQNECKKRNLDFNIIFNEENINKLLSTLKLETEDDIYFSVSTLRYLPSTILSKLNINHERKKVLPKLSKNNSKLGIIVSGSTDLLTTLASCCNPVYGEEIVGYITKGYGVKIHSKNCKNIQLDNERIIDAQWDTNITNKYTVKLKVYINDIKTVLVDIAALATKHDITLESMTLINRNNEMFYDIKCKVFNVDKLNIFIDEIRNIISVDKVDRVLV